MNDRQIPPTWFGCMILVALVFFIVACLAGTVWFASLVETL